MLLKDCICGVAESIDTVMLGIDVSICSNCKVIRQRLDLTPSQYFNFYSSEYHNNFQTQRGTSTYQDRYKHDLSVAALRIKEYLPHLTEMANLTNGNITSLDIGSSNNAFVDLMREHGYDAFGVEIGEEGQNHPNTTFNQDLLDLKLDANTFCFVTMHDVLEHLIDPTVYLEEVHRIMKPGGTLVVDFPSFFKPEGLHHWKPIEHLWMLNEVEVANLLESVGFELINLTVPIPSKFVIYARKLA